MIDFHQLLRIQKIYPVLTGIEVILMTSPACLSETKEKVVNDQFRMNKLAVRPFNEWNNRLRYTTLESSKVALGYRLLLAKGVQISKQLLADYLVQPSNQRA